MTGMSASLYNVCNFILSSTIKYTTCIIVVTQAHVFCLICTHLPEGGLRVYTLNTSQIRISITTGM